MVSIVTPWEWDSQGLSKSVQNGIRKEAVELRDMFQEEATEVGDRLDVEEGKGRVRGDARISDLGDGHTMVSLTEIGIVEEKLASC